MDIWMILQLFAIFMASTIAGGVVLFFLFKWMVGRVIGEFIGGLTEGLASIKPESVQGKGWDAVIDLMVKAVLDGLGYGEFAPVVSNLIKVALSVKPQTQQAGIVWG